MIRLSLCGLLDDVFKEYENASVKLKKPISPI